jgi:hypothetical protein
MCFDLRDEAILSKFKQDGETVMKATKEIKLYLDLENKRDKNIYKAITAFGENHDIKDESDALKAFILYLHFLGEDIVAINEKIKGLS